MDQIGWGMSIIATSLLSFNSVEGPLSSTYQELATINKHPAESWTPPQQLTNPRPKHRYPIEMLPCLFRRILLIERQELSASVDNVSRYFLLTPGPVAVMGAVFIHLNGLLHSRVTRSPYE